jgi:hypothetical protein
MNTIDLAQARERYNNGFGKKEIASMNIEAFQTVLRTLDVDDRIEAPLNTIIMMYPSFGNKFDMCKDELEFRLALLKQAGFLNIRIAPSGTQMVSITEYGHERYAVA